LTPAGKYPTWKIPPSVTTASINGDVLYSCPLDKQVPYTPPPEDMRLPNPRQSIVRVYNRTYQQARCFNHKNDACSPSKTPKSRQDWTTVDWDSLDCDSFLVGTRKIIDYEAYHYGGTCLMKKLDLWPKPAGLGVVMVGNNQLRSSCDYGSETNVQADPKTTYAYYGTEKRRKWCPVCHWANDGTVCNNVPQLIPYQSAYNWCWSSHKSPTAKSDEPADWRWRVISWTECVDIPAMLRGWVACPAPTCKDDFRARANKDFKCTAEYLAMGICDVVGPSGKYAHKSGLKENYGAYGSTVYTCNPGEWVPVTRPLECPSGFWKGQFQNGTWTKPTTETTTRPCSSFMNPFNLQCPPCKRPDTCPSRCAWSPESGCTAATTTTTTTEPLECADITSEKDCTGDCQWDVDHCMKTPCGEHSTEQSCPEGTYCKWNGKTHQCVVRQCVDYKTQDTCPEKCDWSGGQCKATLPFKLCEATGANGANECPEGCEFVTDCDECAVAAEFWMGIGKAKDYDDTLWPASSGARPQGCFRNKGWNIKCNPFLPGEKWPNNKDKVGPRKNKYPICKKSSCRTVCEER